MNIKIYLKKGGSISGRVFHPDGITPAKRAAVSRARWFYGRAENVYTDENGKYTIIGLSGGRKQVLADLDGYTVELREVDVQVGKAVENIDFILGQGKVSVKGKILSATDNREIENAKIYFFSRMTGEKYSGGDDRSDNNGNYSILGFLEPGKFEVSIIHEEYEILETVVELKPGENNLDFEMQPEKASEKKMSRTRAGARGRLEKWKRVRKDKKKNKENTEIKRKEDHG
ncbi:MAG: carboxypeptidase regulatory-like domain-containing protein [bacterium]|nr:carboxypeptidase regulatory-like domain-containing protein [bacterium]